MASIAFHKLHQRQEVLAMFRHSETTQRLAHQHSNDDINKSLTKSNVDYKNLGYAGTVKAYDERLAEVDKNNSNKRKDRVTCFELSIPFPELSKSRWQECQSVILDWLDETFGINLVNSFIHYDEVHEYVDHGTVKTSRPHVHAFVIPETCGKLNGKEFSARKSMIALNQSLDKKIRDNLDVSFLTHEKPRQKSVEELKMQSYKELHKELVDKAQKLQKINELEEMISLYQQVYGEEFEISLDELAHSRDKDISR